MNKLQQNINVFRIFRLQIGFYVLLLPLFHYCYFVALSIYIYIYIYIYLCIFMYVCVFVCEIDRERQIRAFY